MTEIDEKVRLAHPGDDMSLLALMQEVHRESGLFPIDTIAALSMLRRCIMRHDGMIGVIGPVGDARAAVMLTVDRMWYAGEQDGRYLGERFLIVAPNFRRSNYAKRLMAFSKEAARLMKMKLIIGVASNENVAGKIRLYQRQFPNKIGENFMFDGAS